MPITGAQSEWKNTQNGIIFFFSNKRLTFSTPRIATGVRAISLGSLSIFTALLSRSTGMPSSYRQRSREKLMRHPWTWLSWCGKSKLPNEHPLEHCVKQQGIIGRFPCFPQQRGLTACRACAAIQHAVALGSLLFLCQDNQVHRCINPRFEMNPRKIGPNASHHKYVDKLFPIKLLSSPLNVKLESIHSWPSTLQ